MGLQDLPNNLDLSKLFIDVKLSALSADNPKNSIDLTGKKSFTADFWRQGKGFGITSISIETKTNLQPIIDITFKDLYGALVFGDTMGGNNKDENNSPIRYSVLFDWPPPKFLFTYKGYLGQPVTYILNLKKTSTKYVASDGSYEISASFVPNQWGFFADIPFLYLLAVKKLKEDVQGSPQNLAPISKNSREDIANNINDLIKIGKRVQTKNQEATKEFEGIQQKVAILKSDGGAVLGLINSTFKPGDIIDGTVAGRAPIRGLNIAGQDKVSDIFQPIKITLPKSLTSQPNLQETLKQLQLNSTGTTNEHRKIISLISNPTGAALNESTLGVINNLTAVNADYNRSLKIIDDDLNLIKIETQRQFFQTTKDQLGSLTISEVFSRLAGDTAFVLGSILDAGNYGREFNKAFRENPANRKKLIGKSFPLTLDLSTGEQVPSKEAGIENEGCEMDFVRKFITAVSAGVAENRATEDDKNLSSTNQLVERINNLEILSDNPYIGADYKKLAENLLVRSGIAAFITRSDDPNLPGDYHNPTDTLPTLHDRDGDIENFKTLAKKELKNIPDSILANLSNTDKNKLIVFCKFFTNLLTADGTSIKDVNGSSVFLFQQDNTVPLVSLETIKNYHVTVGEATISDTTIVGPVSGLTLSSPFAGLSGTITKTVGDVFSEFTGKTSLFFDSNSLDVGSQTPSFSSSIDFGTFKSGYFYHNNLLWFIPNKSGEYIYTIFTNPSDVISLNSIKNNDSDATFADKKFKNQDEPNGLVVLTNGNSDAASNPDQSIALSALNERIDKTDIIDYSNVKGLNSIPTIKNSNGTFVPDTNALLLNKVFDKSPVTTSNIGSGVDFIIYSHINSTYLVNNQTLVWDLFGTDIRSRNQRVFLRALCVDILQRLTDIDTQTNNIISQVLGKASSYENALYQQMHNIYQQWSVLGLDGEGNAIATTPFKPRLSEFLESEYNRTIDVDSNGKLIDLGNGTNAPNNTTTISTGFRYDFPIERVNTSLSAKTNVAHSIINIEPLYKPNANTTVLNLFLSLCTKNNFLFIPIPGNADYTRITDIFKPYNSTSPHLGNIFHVLFTPTPESRAMYDDKSSIASEQENAGNYDNLDAFRIDFGSVGNTIISNISVSTEDNKPTAESILNLQKLVDKNNTNKSEGLIDNSTLSIMEGRSYKITCEVLGNAQISPMQFFIVSKAPIFGGLYQVMNVKHNITANNMKTEFEGMKMRFSPGFSGIKPITLESLAALGGASNIQQPMAALISSLSNIPIIGSAVESLFGTSKAQYGLLDPLNGKGSAITSFANGRTNPITGSLEIHGAIDIAAVEGTIVYAIADGIVSRPVINNCKRSGPNDTAAQKLANQHCGGGFGNKVYIKHDQFGAEAVYPHMQEGSVLVTEGQIVKRGDPIGKVGSTGFSTGPHLHFQMTPVAGNPKGFPLIVGTEGVPNHPKGLMDPIKFLTIKTLDNKVDGNVV